MGGAIGHAVCMLRPRPASSTRRLFLAIALLVSVAALCGSIAMDASAGGPERATKFRDPQTSLLKASDWGQWHRPAAEVLFRGATKRDIVCVGPTSKHFELVYAHSTDVPDEYDRIAPLLRIEAYKASAFLRLESRTAAPTIDTRLRVLCERGEPVVRRVHLTTASATSDLETVRKDLHANGIAADESMSGTTHALVYVDGHVVEKLAGISDGLDDDRASAANTNLGGGFVSMEYGSTTGPFWETMLHELAHGLGAVQLSAPHEKDGHCSDGNDTMCGATGKAACTYIAFDCGKDDYFHPLPKAGNYLAKKWNLGSAHNTYFDRRVIRPDRSAPKAPHGLRSSTSYLVRWKRPADDTGVVGYQIECQNAKKAWRAVAVTPVALFDWNRCGGSMRVSAIDAWGRVSKPATLVWSN